VLSVTGSARSPRNIFKKQRTFTYIQPQKNIKPSPVAKKAALQPNEASIVSDATQRIKEELKSNNNINTTERIVYTYSFSGNKPLEISKKIYSTNYHEKPNSQSESYNATQKSCSNAELKQFKVVFKSSDPEQLSFLEKDHNNCNLKRSSISIKTSFIA